MEVTRVPLQTRIQQAGAGKVSQPEYLPTLIRQWAALPIRAYFGGCTAEQQRLYGILGLAAEDNPSYGAVAQMILAHRACAFGGFEGDAADLLAVPVLANEARRKGGKR